MKRRGDIIRHHTGIGVGGVDDHVVVFPGKQVFHFLPGQPLGGIGAEIALEPVNNVIQLVVPGATMRGIRPHGFGELADRTFQFCSPDDSICDAPLDISNAIGRALDLAAANGIHAQYASNQNVIPGTTTPEWIVDWSHGLINQ